jgi:hypothetical protein
MIFLFLEKPVNTNLSTINKYSRFCLPGNHVLLTVWVSVFLLVNNFFVRFSTVRYLSLSIKYIAFKYAEGEGFS